jgi:hypothetical protein
MKDWNKKLLKTWLFITSWCIVAAILVISFEPILVVGFIIAAWGGMTCGFLSNIG